MYFNKKNSFSHGIMFHHFHDNNKHPQGQGSINQEEFFKIIKFIERKNIINADEFYEKIKKEKLKKNEVCLTFDDGLKCFYDIVFPILENLKIKSFFFTPTSIFENHTDHLEVYRYFRMNFFKNVNEFYELFFIKCKQEELNKFIKLNQKKIISIKKKFKFYSFLDIKFRLVRNKLLNTVEYSRIMHQMFDEKKFKPNKYLKDIFLSLKDIIKLKSKGHIIGLHSHTHPNKIDDLSQKEQEKEYTQNKELLMQILKLESEEIKSMAHPGGQYNEETIKILNNLGIHLGFRDNMFLSGKMKKINNSHLEIARNNHADILKLIK